MNENETEQIRRSTNWPKNVTSKDERRSAKTKTRTKTMRHSAEHSRTTKHEERKKRTKRKTRGHQESTRNENRERPERAINGEGKSGITARKRKQLRKTNYGDANERSNSYTTKNALRRENAASDTDTAPAFRRNARNTAPRQTSWTHVAPRTRTRRALW